jgi:hypothetical protein
MCLCSKDDIVQDRIWRSKRYGLHVSRKPLSDLSSLDKIMKSSFDMAVINGSDDGASSSGKFDVLRQVLQFRFQATHAPFTFKSNQIGRP